MPIEEYKKLFHIYEANDHYKDLGSHILTFENPYNAPEFQFLTIKIGSIDQCRNKLTELLDEYSKTHLRIF